MLVLGGIPGKLTKSQLQRENYFSAATNVANLGETCFNGQITYDKEIDGFPMSGFGPTGVEVFAPGNRNPFGVVVHSNGNVYGTDNGPNNGFGRMATDCTDDPAAIDNPNLIPGIPDEYEKDKLNVS